ncbi:energy transducer TonB [Haliscomenobacter sp.]|uniref:energy transducer TonB n=1 Tax=Haliscomenobacter sp. TaxID=2717303 RepID=UPI003593D4C5
MNATDPMHGTQEGGNVQARGAISVFPGTSPLFQLSWLREVFRYRNQEYGAYYLRQQYPRNMMWGGLLSISLIGLLYGGSLLAQALQEKMISMREYTMPNMVTPPPPVKEETPPPPPVTPPPPPARPTIIFVVPKVLDDNQVPEEYEPPTQADLVDKNPGTVTSAGDPNGVDYIPEETPIEPLPPPIVVEGEKEIKESIPFVFVEQMPAFRGVLQKYLAEQLEYPTIAKENGIQGIVVIQFVVNEEGKITNPFIAKDIGGGCGEEALRVVRSMPEWLAGKQRGVPVKVQMNLPVKFKLE